MRHFISRPDLLKLKQEHELHMQQGMNTASLPFARPSTHAMIPFDMGTLPSELDTFSSNHGSSSSHEHSILPGMDGDESQKIRDNLDFNFNG